MRIQRLDLERFGHFTDQKFDFGAARDGHDFHIIYGPNEAGKTTTMEAVLRLFYGFPLREGYAFKHPRNNLQVSATLDFDGTIRRLTRRPMRSGSLVDDTGTPLPEAALSSHLAGLSEEDYRRLFCLDDETIERGGEEIANAEGDIGRLLFSAAAGVADLSSVMDGVRERADALWKKRGRTTRMAELKRALADVEKKIKEGTVTASAWQTMKKNLIKSQEDERDARLARDELNTAKAETEAQRRALPLLDEITNIEAAIAPFSTYPNQLDFDPESLITLRSDRGIATRNIERLTDEIAELEETRKRTTFDPRLLDLSTELAKLEDLSARDRTAKIDLDRRRDEERVAEAAMQQALRDLGITPSSVDPQKLVLTTADIAALESAREALRNTISQVKAEAREVDDLQDKVSAAREAVQDNPALAEDALQVTDILLRFDADSLAPEYAAAIQAIEAAKVRVKRSLSALSFAGITFDHLPSCLTSPLQATTWADRHQELVRDLRTTTEKRVLLQEEAEARHAQAQSLKQDTKIVSDAEASNILALRDARWSEHLAALDTRSATVFHEAMQQHDAAAEARLTQSRELAQLREIEQAAAEARARAIQTEKCLATIREELTSIEAAASEAASRIGLPSSITPAEWLVWVLRHQATGEEAQALRETEDANHTILQRAEDLLAELAKILPTKPVDLESALNMARRTAEDERQQADARAKATDTLRQAQRDLARRKDRYEDALKAQEGADDTWQRLVRDRLGGALPAERLMASLEPLRELREQETERAAAERRVKTMKADQEQFAQEVDALTRTYGLAPQTTAAQTYAALKDSSKQALTDQETGKKLDAAIEAAEIERGQNKDRQDTIDQEIEAIAAVFPDPASLRDIDALRQVATRAQQVIENRAKLEDLRRRVLSDFATADIETARIQLSETTTAALEATLESNGSDLAHAEEELTRAIQERVTAEHALAEVTGDDEIAALVEQRATLEMQLEEAALEHLKLSLGHHLASDAIRRYRDSHRSGMLSATEQCFSDLTQGAYPSLNTQIEKDAEVLLAVDKNGVSKRAAEMSKGTRFQLYLALRAAAHEQLVAQGTKLPFFCDDIFETFDEDRTSAACRVMETIGGRGQAIYLTHHRHVVEIAKNVCLAPPIIHEL